MKNTLLFLISLVLGPCWGWAQSLGDLMDEVSRTQIVQTVRELSGEDSCLVNGQQVLILDRVSQTGNEVAADYIFEQFQRFGLHPQNHQYSSTGRNVTAQIKGKINPDSVYIICGHFDGTHQYGADDNASGIAAVLEAARILSAYELKNTLIFAAWDQEEIGLIGAKNYAKNASLTHQKIKGVLNMDMIGYDGDGDKLFDIDVRNIANSYQIKEDLIAVVTDENLDLVVAVVDPGTLNSDHSAFWDQGYSAVLLGEAWSVKDINPGYHTIHDRISLFNFDYFEQMVKLAVGYAAKVAQPQTPNALEDLALETTQVFPTSTPDWVRIPHIQMGSVQVSNLQGQILITQPIGLDHQLDLRELPSGIYLVHITTPTGQIKTTKVFKE